MISHLRRYPASSLNVDFQIVDSPTVLFILWRRNNIMQIQLNLSYFSISHFVLSFPLFQSVSSPACASLHTFFHFSSRSSLSPPIDRYREEVGSVVSILFQPSLIDVSVAVLIRRTGTRRNVKKSKPVTNYQT